MDTSHGPALLSHVSLLRIVYACLLLAASCTTPSCVYHDPNELNPAGLPCSADLEYHSPAAHIFTLVPIPPSIILPTCTCINYSFLSPITTHTLTLTYTTLH